MELEELIALVQREQQGEISYGELLSPRYANAIAVGSLVHLFAIYDGYILLIYFSTLIFSAASATANEHQAIECNIVLGLVDILAVLLYSKFSDSIFGDTVEYGRKEFLMFGAVGLTVANFFLALSAYLSHRALPFVSYVFVLIHSSSNGPTSYFFSHL
eukprot:TRINITY_DN1501_c0_g1_i1.p1 TRINITY_DN1501_c0_g1~~TRINITY_DN1501_c0_g1_i1.p1  ORF type:complete len:159 (+),score=33.66 TRINITY_DN1501_c0_g1_i1:467-943(+)